MLESDFKAFLRNDFERRFPGCWLITQDPNASFQGIQDLLFLFGEKWALLETKRATNAAKRVNQDYYVELFDKMGFSAFINPDNYEEVVGRLESYIYG